MRYFHPLERIVAVFLQDKACLVLLLLQICMDPSFRHVIYIPSKLKIFRIIINIHTQFHSKIHIYLHFSCHIDFKHPYLMVCSQLILIK